MIIISFFSMKHKFWACKRNVSRRHFFYAPKTYAIIDSYLKDYKKVLYSESSVSQIYFELVIRKIEVRIFKVSMYLVDLQVMNDENQDGNYCTLKMPYTHKFKY